jgi:hypothetical protein
VAVLLGVGEGVDVSVQVALGVGMGVTVSVVVRLGVVVQVVAGVSAPVAVGVGRTPPRQKSLCTTDRKSRTGAVAPAVVTSPEAVAKGLPPASPFRHCPLHTRPTPTSSVTVRANWSWHTLCAAAGTPMALWGTRATKAVAKHSVTRIRPSFILSASPQLSMERLA